MYSPKKKDRYNLKLIESIKLIKIISSISPVKYNLLIQYY